MKRIIITTLILTMFSCVPNEIPKPPKTTVETSNGELTKDNTYYNQRYEEYSLEGCQYIVVGIGQNKWGSHKGNCCNPIHNK